MRVDRAAAFASPDGTTRETRNNNSTNGKGTSGGANKNTTDVAAVATLMMFDQQPAAESPDLKTGNWSCKDAGTPDPITVEKAQKPLAGWSDKHPCEVPGEGMHGYAWMLERE